MSSSSDSKRQAVFQENVNKKALIDWVRITGLPNLRKRNLDRLLDDFARDILKYPSEHATPFSWPTGAGFYGNHLAIRARMSYHFWKYFMQEGRKHLYEYNKQNGVDIKINREKTLSLQDQDRLGLYVRKTIRNAYTQIKQPGVEVTLKKGFLKIGEHPPMRPALAAYLLGLDMSAWNGLPLESMLTEADKSSISRGEIKQGSLTLPNINLSIGNDQNENLNENTGQNLSVPPNGDESSSGSSVCVKKRLLVDTSVVNEGPASKRGC
ncbi:hypothetical protein Aduo_018971 [Ancylostoma duodenale]